MTERYDMFIKALRDTNNFIAQMFLFAVLAIAAYRALDWLPDWLRCPARYLYLAFVLAASIFIPVFFWLM